VALALENLQWQPDGPMPPMVGSRWPPPGSPATGTGLVLALAARLMSQPAPFSVIPCRKKTTVGKQTKMDKNNN
jgi:hypothetical protein